MKYVNMPVPKTDAMSLVTGKPVYTDDLAPSDCLIVKLLRSPHANAWVEEIKTDAAKKSKVLNAFLLMRMFHINVSLWQVRLHRRSVRGIDISLINMYALWAILLPL